MVVVVVIVVIEVVVVVVAVVVVVVAAVVVLLRLVWSMVVVMVEVEKNLEQMEINHNHVIYLDHMIMVDFHLLNAHNHHNR